MHLDLTSGLALFGALATGSSLLNAWMTNRVRLEVVLLKLEASELRAKDRERLDEKLKDHMTQHEFDKAVAMLEAKWGMKVR